MGGEESTGQGEAGRGPGREEGSVAGWLGPERQELKGQHVKSKDPGWERNAKHVTRKATTDPGWERKASAGVGLADTERQTTNNAASIPQGKAMAKGQCAGLGQPADGRGRRRPVRVAGGGGRGKQRAPRVRLAKGQVGGKQVKNIKKTGGHWAPCKRQRQERHSGVQARYNDNTRWRQASGGLGRAGAGGAPKSSWRAARGEHTRGRG